MKRFHLIALGLMILLTSCTLFSEQPVYYRVKHDSQLKMYDFQSRTAADDWHGVSS